MSNTPRTITPKSIPEFPDYLDFGRLKAEGIKHIQDLAGNIWTDHNVHDPGITVLEVLCYALTDLGYRANLDIRDLLARDPQSPDSTDDSKDDNFVTAARILGCNPTTILDFRKLLIDIEGVHNAWLVPATGEEIAIKEAAVTVDCKKSELNFYDWVKDSRDGKPFPPPLSINGLYKVYLEIEESFLNDAPNECGFPENRLGDVLAEVNKRLHGHRNLCEDYLDIKILRDERISLCAEIEIDAAAQPNEVMLRIFEQFQAFLSPNLSFYTLKEMLAQGKTPDEIFEGRPLMLDNSHGFIDSEALLNIQRRTEIRISDIYRLLLDIEGVSAIKTLRLLNLTNGVSNEGEEWLLPLNPNHFRPILAATESANSIIFTKRSVSYYADSERVLSIFEKKLANRLKVKKQPYDLDLPIPRGEYRSDLADYFSIQNDFPATYAIGEQSFPTGGGNTKEKANILQFKGYLLFFDQLLTNYLSQLANVRNLFSTNLDEKTDATIATGSLKSVPFSAELLKYTEGGKSKNDGFAIGDVIAVLQAPASFPTPQERDRALEQVVADFDNRTIIKGVTQDPITQLYHFIVESRLGRSIILKSKNGYKTVDEANRTLGKVLFLATLPESYNRTAKQTQKRYGFEWVFILPNYKAFLRNIIESPEQYFERKNRLFDHLLSRFAEDFTDYTLLMFGMYKNRRVQPTARDFSRDKANFLKHYPAISRDRGRGLNLQKTADYWSGKNTSGLEMRVGNILGFAQRPSKQLNYFDITPRTARQHDIYYDPFGRPLLKTPRPIELDKKADFELELINAALNIDHIQPIDCSVDKVYGFRLFDTDGCVVAVHPNTYGTAELRDGYMRYTQGIINDSDRLMVVLQAQTEGFYFTLKYPNSPSILYGTMSVTTSDQAHLNAHRLLKNLRDWACYQPIDEPTSRGFSFEIYNTVREDSLGDGVAVALNLPFLKTPAERDAVMKRHYNYYRSNPLRWQAHQLSQRMRWQIIDNQGVIKLQSIHFFKNSKQTFEALRHALNSATDENNYEPLDIAHGKYSFRLLRYDIYSEETNRGVKERTLNVPLAQPPNDFTTRTERDEAIKAAIQAAQALSEASEAWMAIEDNEVSGATADDLWVQFGAPKAQGQLQVLEGLFYADLKSTNGTVWLRDERRFETAEAAEMAFYDILEAVCLDKFLDRSDNNGCAFGFDVGDDASKPLAYHPHLYTSAPERDAVVQAIKDLVCKNRPGFEILENKGSWYFEWFWLNRYEQLVPILRGSQKYAGEDAQKNAQEASDKCRAIVKNDINTNNISGWIDENTTFSFSIKEIINETETITIAEHPEKYETFEECNDVIQRFIPIFKSPHDAFELEKTNVCDCLDTDGNKRDDALTGWRVWDENDALARHTTLFKKQEDAQKCLARLIDRYRCHPPQYSCLTMGDVTWRDAEGILHFALRDDKQIYWLSVDGFGSVAQAREAFEAQFLDIIEAARDLNNYKVCSKLDKNNKTIFRIELLNDRHRVIAQAFGFFTKTEGVNQAIARLHNHALLFPILEKANGFGFQIYSLRKQQPQWQSIKAYLTWQEAEADFVRFLDLLTFEQHFHLSNPGNCGWRVTLTEVILESHEAFFTKIKGKNTSDDDAERLAWHQVENFLDTYQRNEDDIIFDCFIDYTDNCHYRLRLTDETFRHARHPKAYHTPLEREAARDDVWRWFNNREMASDNTTFTLMSELADPANYKVTGKIVTVTLNFIVKGTTPEAVVVEIPTTFSSNEEALAYVNSAAQAAARAQEAMRFIQNFVVFTERDGYRVGVRDFDGTLLLVLQEPKRINLKWVLQELIYAVDTEGVKLLLADIERYYAASQLNAIFQKDKKFTFELRRPKGQSLHVVNGLIQGNCEPVEHCFTDFEVVWESIALYDSLQKVRAAFSLCLTLLGQKENYSRSNAPDTSFTLTLTNSSGILAVHPRHYTSRSECREAILRIQNYVDTEGLHLVEHVLLRPRRQFADLYFELKKSNKPPVWLPSLLMPIALKQIVGEERAECAKMSTELYHSTKEIDLFDNYIPNADPYSFVITIVLPYWARRFRDVDFRDFFENTLRRETPAHVALRILWVTPRDMQRFENAWRCWLEVADSSQSADFPRRTACLVKTMSALTNTFPAAILNDCGDGNPILLDKTSLE